MMITKVEINVTWANVTIAVSWKFLYHGTNKLNPKHPLRIHYNLRNKRKIVDI